MYARGSWSRGAVLLISGLLLSCASSPESQDPASVSRTISPAEVDALLLGQGMGMAAPAEINGYPEPRHVLDLKDELNLTPDQRFATSRLMGATLGQTRALGQRIVEAERRLDAEMASGELSSAQVKARLENIASLRAQLRFTHIEAHLKQKKILTQEQVVRYYELRGRDVVVPPPGELPEVTEALMLPAETAPQAVDVPAEQAPVAKPFVPALPSGGAPVVLPVPAIEDSAPPLLQEETFVPALDAEDAHFEPEVEIQAAPPVVPAPPAEAPKGLSPGMQDALDEAEPAPVTIKELPPQEKAAPVLPPPDVIETAPQLPPPSTQEVVVPVAPETGKPAALSPGMQDAMEEAEPVAIEEAPVLPPPAEKIVAPAVVPAEAPAPAEPAKLSPGMLDAMEEAEPAPAVIEKAPVLPPPAEKIAVPAIVPVEAPAPAEPAKLSPGVLDAMEEAEPTVEEAPMLPAPRTEKMVVPASMSPGMQDAMELAEPLPAAPPLPAKTEAEAVRIAPLEEAELEELPPVDPQEPVMIDLDN